MQRLYTLCLDSWQLALVLGVLWYGLAGLEGWPFGVFVIVLSAMLSRLYLPMELPSFHLPGLVRFVGYFLWSSLLAGIDVAGRTVNPNRPIEIVNHRYRFRLPAGQARTVFVATVTLLPGTLSRSLDDEYLMVHSIAGDKQAELSLLELRVADLFGLSLEA